MERNPIRDAIVGLFVLAGLAALGYLSLSIGGVTLHKTDGFRIEALFDEIGGLKPRAPVTIGGVKVGEVLSTTLDSDFRVRVAMDLDRSLKLPEDTMASVFTEGVLGDRYLALSPGGSDTLLKSGDVIDHTESAIILERFIGKLMYSLTSTPAPAPGSSPTPAPGSAGAPAPVTKGPAATTPSPQH